MAKQRLSKLGEDGLIERIARRTKVDASVIRGIGDDAAVIKYTRDKYLLLACDMLVEGTHFDLRTASARQIGRKALAVNISDIAAMGGIPRHALISAGLPKKTSVKFIDELYAGVKETAKKFGVNIVGGDTNSSSLLVVDVAVLGEVEKRCLTLRSGAKKKDLIMVTGALGGSGSVGHLDFVPRLREARFLVENFRINAMIDVSDGLSSDLNRIAKASNVGVRIYEELIPVSRSAPSLKSALREGEDFELLFTLNRREIKKLIAVPPGKFRISLIGEVVDRREGVKIVGRQGRESRLKPEGYGHF